MTGEARASAPGVSHRARGIAWLLLASGVALYMMLSAQGLLALGIPYDAPWGPFIAKLHPGSWLVAIAYVTLLASYGHPMRVAATQFAAQPLLAVYLGCILFIFGYSVTRYGMSGAAFIIDTLVMPALCVFTLLMLEARQRYAVLVIVVVLLVINTLLGVGESMMQARLIPMRLAGEPEALEDIFRPSALLGHPLANALITATLLPMALHLRIATVWRCLLVLLFWIGVLAFGGRTSFILSTVVFGGYFALRVGSAVLHGRFSYAQLTGGALTAMLTSVLIAVAIATSGIGERIFKSLEWDSSAAVRARIWNVFQFVSPQDMWVGVSPAGITDLVWRLDLHGPGESIENFWLVMYLQLGAIGFAAFALAMLCAMAWLWKNSRGAMRLSVLMFFVAASSNNSLASKSVSFSMLFIAVAVTRARPARRSHRIETLDFPVRHEAHGPSPWSASLRTIP